MTPLATAWMLGCVCGFFMGVTVASCPMAPPKGGYTRRRGSNPPPPGCKPAPPAGPPEQPLAAQLIRYWAWEQEQVRRAAAGQSLIHFDEGPTQRGNGNGAPATPKPDIIPKPQFPPPRKIREDFLP